MNNGFIVDQESVVYGRIKSASSLARKELKQQIDINKKMILSLSDVDALSPEILSPELTAAKGVINDDYPLLTPSMFSVSQLRMKGDCAAANIIHFAMSYYGIEYEWSEWMAKFESLLKSMYWQSAVVHLETEFTGLHTFKWESVNSSHIPGEDNFNVRCEWDHEVSFSE